MLAAAATLALLAYTATATRSFGLSDGLFTKDGKPFRIRSGCVHYARMPEDLWQDRLARLAAMGLNTVETYVFWNWHQPSEGVFDFESPGRNLTRFLELADSYNLSVLMRGLPYSCGEWDGGGIPAWMLKYNFINGSSTSDPSSCPLQPEFPVTIRTNDTRYLGFVDSWLDVLLGKIKSEGHLYEDGGNVIMVQAENEFGSYGNVQSNPKDREYMQHLVTKYRSLLGQDVVIYTTDGGSVGYMEHGSLNGSAVYTVGDTGPGAGYAGAFSAQAQFNPPGSRSNFISEWYTGWLMHFGDNYPNHSSSDLAKWTDAAFNDSGSVSLYMAFGGTNFGFWNGANGGGDSIGVDAASYDYNAPLAEWGTHNWGSDGVDKFEAMRELFSKWAKTDGEPLPPAEPAPRPITALGTVKFAEALPLLSQAARDAFCPASTPGRRVSGLSQPIAMEHPMINQSQGFALYEAALPAQAAQEQKLQFGSTEPRDYAVVSVGGESQGNVFRSGAQPLPISWPSAGATGPAVLSVLVENMGHINYGHGMLDLKGLLTTPTVGGSGSVLQANWSVCSMPLDEAEVKAAAGAIFQPASQAPADGVPQLPAMVSGEFAAAADPSTGKPPSTFLNLQGWGKGVAWVNGHGLGRYWVSKGPQNALYVPESFLVEGTNSVVLLELEALPASSTGGKAYEGLSAVLTAKPDFAGPATCNPAGAPPRSGSNVVMYKCSSAYAKQQSWGLSADGQLQLGDGSEGLCAAAGPSKDPDGQPSVQLQECSAGGSQPHLWKYDGSTQQLQASPGGACMDITAHLTTNGANVETYACNGGTNQQWSQPAAAGHPGPITSKQDGHCLTVCPASSR